MSIRFGVVLPSQIYSEYRRGLARAAFKSLLGTSRPSSMPAIFLVRSTHDEVHPSTISSYENFDLIDVPEPGQELGTESALAYGTDIALQSPVITHVVWLGDDALFNPDWLCKLESLIRRHPQARAWSVYRSAYEAVHATLEVRQDAEVRMPGGLADIRVRSLCGHGLTMTREEWKEWGIKWSDGRCAWVSPSGNTLDMLHVHARPGERWCTSKSFLEHTGRSGKNCHPDIPEWAVDFQGEGGYDTAANHPWKKVFGGGS